ncbi:MAG: hypothetical protein ABJB12_21745 [Pseudomonadota bacterium]
MSINASTNYMSSSSIEAWMEQKTEDLYGSMRGAMDTSNTRADAEQALNNIKAAILNAQKNGTDARELQTAIADTLKQYGDIPEVIKVLTPIETDLTQRIAKADGPQTYGKDFYQRTIQPKPGQIPVKLEKGDSDNWTQEINDTVDGLGKQDQLGMINIQEFNSQINQTKQIASALMDAADKAANAIISHIS